MKATDDAVLDIVEGETLGTAYIEQLLGLVDRGEADLTARLAADADRLTQEISNLMDLVAAGVPAASVAAKRRSHGC